MLPFPLPPSGRSLKVLCLGAHSDDIEIGAGGTIMGLIAAGVELDVHWCVLSAAGPRHDEALAGAEAVLSGASRRRVECKSFRDGFFPYHGAEVKSFIESLKSNGDPDVIFTHRRDDAHQDHREVCRLTSNSFRNHLILEYEIPKWDGDLGRPNFFVPMSEELLERKIEVLQAVFGTQRSKDWFDADTFRGLARLRGMECRAPARFAEAFDVRKIVAQPPQALGTGSGRRTH
jgi:LmbE family N-acetylglucosaminyl deacetylase